MEYLEYGIVRYGTPLYVFNMDEMKDTVLCIRNELAGKAGLCFAMKANPFLTRQMTALIDRIEVCSMGEFEICRKLEIEPEKILISGVLKEKEDIYSILRYYKGACTYTIESLNQFHAFADWCDANNEVIHVYLRLTSGNQFGMEAEIIQNIVSMRDKCPFLKIQGIHYFSGTQKKSMEKIKKELTYLDVFLRELEKRSGFQIEELEYGPGIPVSYFDGQQDMVEENIRMIAAQILAMQWKGSVMLEMGRALAARCGYYLTSVKDIKRNNGRNYCIVDGGIHQIYYDGQIRGMYCPKFQVIPAHEYGIEKTYTVCGSLCTVNDILVQNVAIKNLRVGNVLIFERVGAYAMTEGMAMFLSHELPQAAFYSKEMGWKLARKKLETYKWNMEDKIDDGSIDEHFNGN
ncbi:alanine racemase [Muricomes sp. OA1]|nr:MULTISPECIES: alanine racemase [Clostridia]MCH1971127.1 alanine racemase [Muricomes sp. OA1]